MLELFRRHNLLDAYYELPGYSSATRWSVAMRLPERTGASKVGYWEVEGITE